METRRRATRRQPRRRIAIRPQQASRNLGIASSFIRRPPLSSRLRRLDSNLTPPRISAAVRSIPAATFIVASTLQRAIPPSQSLSRSAVGILETSRLGPIRGPTACHTLLAYLALTPAHPRWLLRFFNGSETPSSITTTHDTSVQYQGMSDSVLPTSQATCRVTSSPRCNTMYTLASVEIDVFLNCAIC